MTLKRLIVIGAGAVGGAIGGLLTNAGFPVVLVTRGENGKRIRNEGLCVRMPGRTLHVNPPCVERIDQLDWQAGDLAMLATKLQDAEAVMDELVADVDNNLPLVCASNGVHGERWAASRFDTVLSMLVWMPATHLLPGEVQIHSGECAGVLDTGPVKGATATALCESFCKSLRQAGFDALVREDIKRWKYAKWITNLGSAAQAMVTDDWQAVAAIARQEGEAVLASAGVRRVPTHELLDRCRHVQLQPIDGNRRKGGSTWQSRQRGKPMETPWIEGAMADLADEIGVSAPVNRFLSNASRAARSLLAAEVFAAIE